MSVDLERDGYEEHEYVASGTASSYSAPEPLSGDGRWSFTPDASAPYPNPRLGSATGRTLSDFSGTVVVEWLERERGRGRRSRMGNRPRGDRPAG